MICNVCIRGLQVLKVLRVNKEFLFVLALRVTGQITTIGENKASEALLALRVIKANEVFLVELV